MTNLGSMLKSKDITLLTNIHVVKTTYGLSSSHARMWKLDHKEGIAPKSWYLRTVLLEKILESPLDSKEIKPVNLKGSQPWIFIGRTDVEAEAFILWPPYVKSGHWKRPWYWERLKAEGQEYNRGWNGWMVSLIQWTWTWLNSGRQWGTGKPWHAAVPGVAKSWTRLDDWTITTNNIHGT